MAFLNDVRSEDNMDFYFTEEQEKFRQEVRDFLEEELGMKVDIVSERAVRQELQEQILNEAVMV